MSNSSDDDPHPTRSTVDTREFFFPGAGVSALLVHGLSGTPYEMRFLGERLAAAGVRVCGVRLAGHAAEPQDLGAATHAQWYESVVEGFERLRQFGDPNVVIGLSMGGVLAARLAADQREAVAGVVMLSPAFFLPLWIRAALRAVRALGPFASRIYLRCAGADIHDDAARSVHPSTPLMPLSAVFELLDLSAGVRARLGRVTQPALIIHSRQDHVCPADKNVEFVLAHLGSLQKRAIYLDKSFHVITVDSEKERVAAEVVEFAASFRPGVQPASALG
ncbi:MAG TPA: alpha/beta fold hydrolase [Candidatus Binataceae bacterium]|jgi:carboxylesterase|nr:alpha/beta fold hydrolase [Candidatus Binataceae bacterium]